MSHTFWNSFRLFNWSTRVENLPMSVSLTDADYSSKACNWPLARQDAKERESREDIPDALG
jgi:hypothetical protein